ncbi:DUF4349 domain-containing protein [Filobacillus milosensis]|uniref:DUF4349 domain-containing protein n=1 Tax=Filobacillus milosensis TaxID=94137 RepID=A0A4Y8IB35_9BACI|nr:DUF4349 domain-containing protein [Filobacillus milosensis]TFB13162.1 DUF4349 domain-containing protein [Filobacillus milosensis]
MKKVVLFLVLLLLVGLYACSNSDPAMDEGSSSGNAAEDNADDGGFEQQKESTTESGSGNADDAEYEGEQSEGSKTSKRMMIRTGYIDIEVSDYSRTVDRINEEIKKVNGYIVNSSQYNHGEDENTSGEMTIRVPEEHFQEFMDSLKSEDARIRNTRTEGKDVTEEYEDLESRLRAQEAVEERLLAFMENAQKTEDLLKISDDLTSVQSEIEKIKGRMNYLENHVAFSTINISIQERSVKVPEVQSQSELNTLSKAQKLFMDTINFLLNIGSGIVVAIVGFSPILIPLIIIGLFVFLRRRKRYKSE